MESRNPEFLLLVSEWEKKSRFAESIDLLVATLNVILGGICFGQTSLTNQQINEENEINVYGCRIHSGSFSGICAIWY
jgi:hypothetical protein